jgi:diacylglycerol kinase (ATP)
MPVVDKDRRVHVILNPRSGIGAAQHLYGRIARELAPLEVVRHVVEKGQDIRPQVRAALEDGATDGVAAGGDGTVSAVAEVLSGREEVLGIIPTGTANMMARELNIPLSVALAARAIKSRGRIGRLDGMVWGDRSFFYQVVVGGRAEAFSKVSEREKVVLGRGAYALAGLRQLTVYHPINIRCTVDGRVYRMRVHQVIIANAGILGLTPFRLGPRIRPDDGKIEVIAMRGRTRRELMSSGLGMAMGNYSARGLHYFDAWDEIALETGESCLIRGDGELIGQTPLHLKVVPGAVKVILPGPGR